MANLNADRPRSKFHNVNPQPMSAEAIAMRRIVVEMGYWLSPFMRDEPLPDLTDYERTVDLAKLARNETSASKSRTRLDQSKAVLERIDRGGAGRQRVYDCRTVTDVNLSRTKTPATRDNLQARKAHKAEIVARAAAEGRSPDEVERELAIARIKAVADELAAAQKKVDAEARAARRKETARAANERYKAKLAANPDLAEARRASQRARQRKGAPRPMPNPHRDPTLPTARQLREEAAAAEAIEAEERRLLALLKSEGRRAASERNLHPAPKRVAGTRRDDR